MEQDPVGAEEKKEPEVVEPVVAGPRLFGMVAAMPLPARARAKAEPILPEPMIPMVMTYVPLLGGDRASTPVVP